VLVSKEHNKIIREHTEKKGKTSIRSKDEKKNFWVSRQKNLNLNLRFVRISNLGTIFLVIFLKKVRKKKGKLKLNFNNKIFKKKFSAIKDRYSTIK
jgi:hypothetical protein